MTGGGPPRRLYGSAPLSPAELLEAAARWARAHEVQQDLYGQGGLLAEFERKVADRLGFAAARFMPSGVMAQTAALRVWCERAGRPLFGMHPTSHLELHEERSYRRLHGLDAVWVGPRDRPMLASHLAAVREPLAALLVELPIREAGGQLPSWGELTELKAACAARGWPLHLDGARLWECGPAYQRPYAEICAGFDSVYVSFYKGVGALPGAMLLGDADFVAEAAIWQRRMGGTLYTQLASVVTAAMRFDEALERMPARWESARAVAAAMADIPGLQVWPNPPHTPMFHVIGALPAEVANDRVAQVAEQLGLRLFPRATDGPVPGTFRVELSIGDLAASCSMAEVRAAWLRLMA